MSGLRQTARMLEAANKDALQIVRRSYPYRFGYLEGGVKTAIIRLEHDDPQGALKALKEALATVAGDV